MSRGDDISVMLEVWILGFIIPIIAIIIKPTSSLQPPSYNHPNPQPQIPESLKFVYDLDK
jgi:hypothetical protein